MNSVLFICFLFLGIRNSSFQFEYEVAKVEKNRVFVVINQPKKSDKELIDQLKKIIHLLTKDKQVNFSNQKLRIAFFNEKRHANYKPEKNELYKSWSDAYIAEYSNIDKKLLIYPIDANRQKHVILKQQSN